MTLLLWKRFLQLTFNGMSLWFRPSAWEQSLLGFRKPLGNVLSRKMKIAIHKTSLPGAPDGEYVVIQFVTSFVNKKAAIETVTPMLDKDGNWRVSGYYIN